jgi:protein-disulfide isomerase
VKKLIAIGGTITIILISVVIIDSFSNANFKSSESNMQRTYGTVDTTMGSPVLGSPMAPITIIEFGDYQCPQCYRWFHTIKPQIEEQYINTGKAKLHYVDLASFGPDSLNASMATYCAGDQGKYWEYHDTLYTNQQGINDGWASTSNLREFASQLDLNMDLFDSCLVSEKYKKRVEHNILESKRNGISGTPSFVIVGPTGSQQVIEGAQPFSVFKQILDSAT